jgi:chromosomal replication initiation ATPase DnaA
MKEYIFKQYLDNILEHMDISLEDFFENNMMSVVNARQILYYMCNERGMGAYDIQNYLSRQGYNVSHSTILHGIKKAKEIIDNDKDYKYIVNKLKEIEA